MLLIFITIFFLIFLLERVYRIRIETNVIKYQYNLYALRDELRDHVITGNINKNDWVFDYLDSSIAKTISFLEDISFYRLIVVFLIYNKDPKFLRAQRHLERELNKPEKIYLKKIDEKFFDILFEYMLSRHRALKLSTNLAFLPFTIWETLKIKWKDRAKKAIESPKYSTIYQYCG